MIKVASSEDYDFYESDTKDPNTLYNIVPKDNPAPGGGYRNKQYIEKIKHVEFPIKGA